MPGPRAPSRPTRNAPAVAAHNVFTRDGTPPAELADIGRAQLAPYDVTLRAQRVTEAGMAGDGFEVTLADGARVRSRTVVLATGVRDVLPETPGFAELWGTGVFHCPYCHGWEVAGRPLAVYASGEAALPIATLIRGWTDDLILFTDGADLEGEARNRLARNGVGVRQERVERLVGVGGQLRAVVLDGGAEVARAGLFLWPRQEQRSPLPHRLGCALTPEGHVEADGFGRTTVSGVYVAGDAGPAVQSVSAAAASGATVGGALNHDLLTQEFAG